MDKIVTYFSFFLEQMYSRSAVSYCRDRKKAIRKFNKIWRFYNAKLTTHVFHETKDSSRLILVFYQITKRLTCRLSLEQLQQHRPLWKWI